MTTEILSTDAPEAPKRRGRPPRTPKAPAPADAPPATPVETPPAPKPAEQAAPEIERPSLRPTLREEDPRTRAARRAAEIKNHVGTMDQGVDEFYVDPRIIPPDWDYEWKRNTVLGQEDPAYRVQLAQMGWEPVPLARHPEMMPSNWSGKTIERKGQILMERPKVLTDEARQIELRRARNQVRQKEAQLNSAPDGQFGRDHDQVKPKINKSYEAIPIPKD
jgi:hypothetical protein